MMERIRHQFKRNDIVPLRICHSSEPPRERERGFLPTSTLVIGSMVPVSDVSVSHLVLLPWYQGLRPRPLRDLVHGGYHLDVE